MARTSQDIYKDLLRAAGAEPKKKPLGVKVTGFLLGYLILTALVTSLAALTVWAVSSILGHV